MADLSMDEVMTTTRAMRRLKPDPVPDEDLRDIVAAATQAPSGANRQSWAFVIVSDAELRRRLAQHYRELGNALFRDTVLADPDLPPDQHKVYQGAMHLVDHLGEAPAIIAACMRGPLPTSPEGAAAYYGSIFPAVQNLMLAARARGLGTTLTTLLTRRQGGADDLGSARGREPDRHHPRRLPAGALGRTQARPRPRRYPLEPLGRPAARRLTRPRGAPPGSPSRERGGPNDLVGCLPPFCRGRE